MNNHQKNKRIGLRYTALLIVIIIVVVIATLCQNKQIKSADIITQKQTDINRTQITILRKHAFSIDSFEIAVEEKFPDVDIVQVGNFTTALDPAEYEARMEHDDLTDIIFTWPLSFGEEYFDDRLLDLSSMSITSRYNVSMLNSISNNGKLYYLPGPAQVRGIVYNKTLFKEKGWVVPNNYDEFIELCKTIEKSGIRSLQLGFKNQEVLDTAFIGYSFANCFSTPKDLQWIADYANGNGNFIDHFSTALDTFEDMIDAGVWQKEDLNIDYSDREKMFFNRECAMIEDSVLLARSAFDISGSTDEFALMPFFNPGDKESDWARLYMVCYIGLNKHLAESQNKEKYDKVLKIMDYISTPEGQVALSADTGAMYSSLKSELPPNTPETKELVDTLAHGRYAIFQELYKIQPVLRKGLAGILAGTQTKSDVVKMIDKANKTPITKDNPSEVLGQATDDFTIMETGNLITDIMRKNNGSDIALFLDGGKDGKYNSRGVTARLYKGDVTKDDIKRIIPDYKYGEQGELWNVTMTGEALINTLEHAISVNNNMDGWFYYFSGLKVVYDPTAEPGNRVKKISMTNGKKIEPKRKYKVTITENSVLESNIKSCEKTGVLLKYVLYDAISQQKTISPSNDGRFLLP